MKYKLIPHIQELKEVLKKLGVAEASMKKSDPNRRPHMRELLEQCDDIVQKMLTTDF